MLFSSSGGRGSGILSGSGMSVLLRIESVQWNEGMEPNELRLYQPKPFWSRRECGCSGLRLRLTMSSRTDNFSRKGSGCSLGIKSNRVALIESPRGGFMANMKDVVRVLKQERDRLTNQLQGISAALSAFGAAYGKQSGARGKMSAAGRERVAEAQRQRWAKTKSGQAKTTATPKKGRT